MRGHFRFASHDPTRYARVYLRWIAGEFRSFDAGVVTVRDSGLTVRSATFGPRSVYIPFTRLNSGWVMATPDDLGVDVRFEFKFPEAVIEGGIALGAAVAAAIVSDQGWRFILGFVSACSGFGALLHYGLARSRIERILRSVAKRVQKTEEESRAELGGLTPGCS